MNIVLYIVMLALQVGDWLTTRTIIRNGGYERNRAVAWLMERVGVKAALGIKTVIMDVIGLVLCYFPSPWGAVLLAVLVAYYVYVVAGNLAVIRRQQA